MSEDLDLEQVGRTSAGKVPLCGEHVGEIVLEDVVRLDQIDRFGSVGLEGLSFPTVMRGVVVGRQGWDRDGEPIVPSRLPVRITVQVRRGQDSDSTPGTRPTRGNSGDSW